MVVPRLIPSASNGTLSVATTHHYEVSPMNPLREMLAPKSLTWMTRKDTWFFVLSLVFGLGFSLVFGCVLFFVNR